MTSAEPTSDLPEPTATGTFAKTPFAHLLVYAHDRQLTGSFELSDESGGVTATILFVEGQPTKARTATTTAYLGKVLVEVGAVTDAQLEERLPRLLSGTELHGQVLMKEGLITEEQLGVGLKAQLLQQMKGLARLPPETVFKYYDGFDALASYGGRGHLGVDPFPIVWGAIREDPPKVHVQAALARLASVGVRLAEASETARFTFEDGEQATVELLRQQSWRLPELLAASTLTRDQAELVLYCLLVTKQVELVRESKLPPPVGVSATTEVEPEPPSTPFPIDALPMPRNLARVQLAQRSIVRAPLAVEEESAARLTPDGDEGKTSYVATQPRSFTKKRVKTGMPIVPPTSSSDATAADEDPPSSRREDEPPARPSDVAPIPPPPTATPSVPPPPVVSEEAAAAPGPQAAAPPTLVDPGELATNAPPPSKPPPVQRQASLVPASARRPPRPPPKKPPPPPPRAVASAPPAQPPSVPAPRASAPPLAPVDELEPEPEVEPDEPSARLAAMLADSLAAPSPHEAQFVGAPAPTSNEEEEDEVPLSSPAVAGPPSENGTEMTPELLARKKEIEDKASVLDKADYYALLGVPRDTPSAEIQKAFFLLAKKWHPDRVPPALVDVKDLCAKVFGKMSEAHQTLMDPQRRAKYDASKKPGGDDSPEAQAQVIAILDAATNFQKAEICLKRNDFKLAEELCRKALAVDPKQADYIAMMAWLDAQKPNRQDVAATQQQIAALTQAIGYSQACEKAFFYRGTLAKRLGQEAQAIKDFKRAFELNPRNVDAQREIRLYNMRGGDKGGKGAKGSEGAGGIFGKLFKK